MIPFALMQPALRITRLERSSPRYASLGSILVAYQLCGAHIRWCTGAQRPRHRSNSGKASHAFCGVAPPRRPSENSCRGPACAAHACVALLRAGRCCAG